MDEEFDAADVDWRETAKDVHRAYLAASADANRFRETLTDALGLQERPTDAELLTMSVGLILRGRG